MGLPLIPLFANLLLMGWAVGMVTTALIMRWGQSAEALAWGIPFPHPAGRRRVLPAQRLAAMGPTDLARHPCHVRLRRNAPGAARRRASAYNLLWAFGLNIVYLIAAGLFFNYMFDLAREKGLLAKLGTQ